MSSRLGGFLDGLNLILRAKTDGRIQGESFFEQFKLKQHQGYDGSDLKYVSGVVSTSGSTATAIITIPVASGKSCHGVFFVGGKQADESDATSALVVGAGVNAAGTTAVKGTQSVTIVESDASTNVTFVADDTADTLVLKVTGIAAEDWLWTSHGFYMLMDTSS